VERRNTDNRENISYYDALAGDYGLFFSDLNRNMDQEGAWLARVLETYGVRTVLDASCGAGRQAVPLRERGFEVTAADPSAAMLHEAETTAREHGVSFPMLNARFADLASHFQADFDAVIALGNGLCNLEQVGEIDQALRSMYACCRTGGVCLIGIKDFESIKRQGERFHGHQIVDRNGTRTVLFEVWDFEDPTLVSTAYLVQHGSSEESASVRMAQTREYMLHESELRGLALAAGFRRVQRLDHPNEAAYALET
jgi:glycine/sarcosine N-methyltransferase